MNKRIYLCAFLFSILNANENVELEKVEVSETISKKDESFEKTKAISTREIDASNTQSLDDIVRSVPGAFTNVDKSQGTINVNIRGMSGFGRVNMMVDGVSQTFYSASSDTKISGGTSSFGALIDPSFITGVDIERGSFSGSGGGNALMGSANFRTLSINDIVKDDNIAGLRLNFSDGKNNIGQNKSAIGGVKFKLGDSAYIGALYGYSTKKVSQKYEVGGGKGETKGSNVWKQCDTDGIGEPLYCLNGDKHTNRYDIPSLAFDVDDFNHKPKTHISKIEYGDDYNTLSLQYRNYNTSLLQRKTKQDTYQLNYNLKDPNNDNIDLNILLAQIKGTQNYEKGTLFTDDYLENSLTTTNKAKTFDINNKFLTTFNNGFIETRVGFNLLKNYYHKSRDTHEIDFVSKIAGGKTEGVWNTYYGWPTNTVYPAGGHEFRSIYLDNTINYGIFTFNTNLNWTRYQQEGEWYHKYKYLWSSNYYNPKKGYKNYFEALDPNFFTSKSKYKSLRREYFYANCSKLKDPENIELCKTDPDKAEEKLSDTNYKGIDSWNSMWTDKPDKFYYFYDEKYYKEYREYKDLAKLKDYKENKYLNYAFGLSAYMHDLFTPFINHSKTHRAPNIKEVYFSEWGPYGTNPNLKPEVAKTWQVGFNSYKDGLFSDDDKFRFKFLTYKTKIKDYIVNRRTFIRYHELGGFNTMLMYPIVHDNYKKDVNIQGIEIELGYDIGWFFTNISYARQKTDQPLNFTDQSPDPKSSSHANIWKQGHGLSKLSMLPKDYATIELGTRLYDEKLTIGMIAKYYGESRITGQNIIQLKDYSKNIIYGDVVGYVKPDVILQKQGFVFDFYTTYKPIKNLTIKAEIQNIFDKAYINPLDANNDSASQFIFDSGLGEFLPDFSNYARGRTALVSFNYEF